MNKLSKNKYHILILSNPKNEEFIEDKYIEKAFREDGHIVKMAWVDYNENLDDKFDIIIRRNTCVENKEETNLYKIKNYVILYTIDFGKRKVYISRMIYGRRNYLL